MYHVPFWTEIVGAFLLRCEYKTVLIFPYRVILRKSVRIVLWYHTSWSVCVGVGSECGVGCGVVWYGICRVVDIKRQTAGGGGVEEHPLLLPGYGRRARSWYGWMDGRTAAVVVVVVVVARVLQWWSRLIFFCRR